METKNKRRRDWIGTIINSKSFFWWAPLSMLLVGFGIVLAVRESKEIAAILIGAITIVLTVFITVIAYVVRHQLSRSASIDSFPKSEYRTLESQLAWTIENETGTKARLEKSKRILVLEEPISVIKEYWWGDGEPPKRDDYEVLDAGSEIGRKFKQGSQWIIEIILNREFTRGEELKYGYVKHLRNSFVSDTEWVETTVASETNDLTLSVVFPYNKTYKSTKAVRRIGDLSKEYYLNESMDNGTDFRSELLEDGRSKIVWQIKSPAKGGVYTIEWDW